MNSTKTISDIKDNIADEESSAVTPSLPLQVDGSMDTISTPKPCQVDQGQQYEIRDIDSVKVNSLHLSSHSSSDSLNNMRNDNNENNTTVDSTQDDDTLQCKDSNISSAEYVTDACCKQCRFTIYGEICICSECSSGDDVHTLCKTCYFEGYHFRHNKYVSFFKTSDSVRFCNTCGNDFGDSDDTMFLCDCCGYKLCCNCSMNNHHEKHKLYMVQKLAREVYDYG